MNWVLLGKDGKQLQKVNCQYDALDIARWEYNASVVHIDFEKNTARIIY